MSGSEWTPYRPPWYPDRGAGHNPFVTDPATYQAGHQSFYLMWLGTTALVPVELAAFFEAGGRGSSNSRSCLTGGTC